MHGSDRQTIWKHLEACCTLLCLSCRCAPHHHAGQRCWHGGRCPGSQPHDATGDPVVPPKAARAAGSAGSAACVWAGSGRSDSPPWASQLQAGPLPGASTWQGVQQQTSTGAQLQATGVPHVPAEVQVTETTGTRGAQPPAAGAAELQVGSTRVCRLMPSERGAVQSAALFCEVKQVHPTSRVRACCAGIYRVQKANVCPALPGFAHRVHLQLCSGHLAGQRSCGPPQEP